MNDKKQVWPLLTVGLASISVGMLCVQSLEGPLTNIGDVGNWTFLANFVRNNLTWGVVPRLELVTNDSMYPYGLDHSMLSWCLERDLLHAALTSALGPGPYLQIYFIFSLLVTGLGAYVIFHGDKGAWPAAGLAVAVVSFNFYALFKYPHHLNIAAAHWGILAVMVDMRLLWNLTRGRIPALRSAGVRLCLLLLSLGLDLVYVAGLALASLAVHAAFAAPTLWKRRSELRAQWTDELRNNRGALYALLSVTLLAAYVYIPLITQIVSHSLDVFPATVSGRWVHPGRLVVPYIGSLAPTFGDMAESDFDFRPGATLLITVLLALYCHRGRPKAYLLPAAFLTLAALFQNAADIPTLSLFPWLQHARVGARWTIFLPAITCVAVAHAQWSSLKQSRLRWLPFAVGALAFIELATVYERRVGQDNPQAPELAEALHHLADESGVAVMEWPFCVVGGNLVGANELCPHERLVGTAGWQYFHRKKTPSAYLGRLSQEQLEPTLSAGWPSVLHNTQREDCFAPRGWEFFTQVLERYDIAGLLLYTRFLDPACVSTFEQHLGPRTWTKDHPRTGPVAFWRRTWASTPDAPEPSYLPSQPTESADLVLAQPPDFNVFGLAPPEQLNADIWRWTEGPAAEIGFSAESPASIAWRVNVVVPKETGVVRVMWNGELLEALQPGEVEETWTVPARAGNNRLRFELDRYNHRGAEIAPEDPRYLGVQFRGLQYVVQDP